MFINVPAASSCALSDELFSSLTSGGMAPAVAMAAWFFSLVSARFVSAPATSSICPSLSSSILTRSGMAPAAATSACMVGCFRVRFIRAPATYSRARREELALSLSIFISGSSALALMMARWFSALLEARFIRQPAACSAAPPPCESIGTSASTALAAAMCRLLSGCAARFISAPAVSSCNEELPLDSNATSGLIAPASSMAAWFSLFWQARFHRAKHACSLAEASPFMSRPTRGSSAPEATMAFWLLGFWMAKLPRMPAAVSCTVSDAPFMRATTAGIAPALVINCWCSMQSARLISARAACSTTSPSFLNSNSSGCSPLAPTTRFDSSGPVAACAAMAAAARVCA
mmetsp:Transcript_51487/g.85382  ORF Transcript_51487/g.85382 Transcript_51487/m.85382 type:complete len:347 (-) Transcript_51487:785-1825(-)